MKCYHFEVYGKVQKVMFRQTFMRAALKYGVIAAASNDPNDRHHVFCYLEGLSEKCELIIDKLRSGMKLNSWGAKVERVDIIDVNGAQADLTSFEVNTINVDSFHWSEGVEFYL